MEEKDVNPYFKNVIAKIILLSALAIIVYMILYWVGWHKGEKDPEKLFNIMLPLISTWVGTILAFYFGKSNFEAASQTYSKVIDKLTPDVLGTILVKQVMIDKFTMVSLDVTNPMIATFDLKGLRDFLDSINKSRLPIMEAGKVKCIIHKSIISDEMLKVAPAVPAATLAAFITANPIIIQFETINEDKKVEDARKLMNEKNYKDLFVVDASNVLVGWLTDTQIMRYMNSQKV